MFVWLCVRVFVCGLFVYVCVRVFVCVFVCLCVCLLVFGSFFVCLFVCLFSLVFNIADVYTQDGDELGSFSALGVGKMTFTRSPFCHHETAVNDCSQIESQNTEPLALISHHRAYSLVRSFTRSFNRTYKLV